MKLSELINKDEDVLEQLGEDAEIIDIHSDSRRIEKGYIFFAISGYRLKGIDFVESAISNGAAAIVCEEDANISELFEKYNLPILRVRNIKSVMARFARKIFNDPSKDMTIIGITGTKGKSTSSFMLKKILEYKYGNVGLIGTIGGYFNDDRIYNNYRTTPESFEIQKFLSIVKKLGANIAIIEVSSQAMITSRVECIKFDIMAFTNFSEEHVSKFEHKSLEEYYNAKVAAMDLAPINILNADDSDVLRVSEILDKKFVYFGRNMISNIVLKKDVELSPKGSKFVVCDDKQHPAEIAMQGEFNIYNALCAMTIAYELGISLDESIENLKYVTVPGRLEPVKNVLGYNILIDYAHTPESLENVLKILKEYAKGRVIVLFGLAGNRGEERHAKMGAVAGKYADFSIITVDSPFDEAPEYGVFKIEEGIKKITKNYKLSLDRRQAIKMAIDMATEDDIILLAGLGHEDHIIVKNKVIPFNERKIVQDYTKEVLNSKK